MTPASVEALVENARAWMKRQGVTWHHVVTPLIQAIDELRAQVRFHSNAHEVTCNTLATIEADHIQFIADKDAELEAANQHVKILHDMQAEYGNKLAALTAERDEWARQCDDIGKALADAVRARDVAIADRLLAEEFARTLMKERDEAYERAADAVIHEGIGWSVEWSACFTACAAAIRALAHPAPVAENVRELDHALVQARTLLQKAQEDRDDYWHLLHRIEPHIDAIVCYASTAGEYAPNQLAVDLRAALARSPTPDAHPAPASEPDTKAEAWKRAGFAVLPKITDDLLDEYGGGQFMIDKLSGDGPQWTQTKMEPK